MTFENPQYLMLLAALPIAAGVVYWAMRSRDSALARIGSSELVRRLTADTNAGGRAGRSVLTITALGLAILALAQPQWGESTQVVERRGMQLMVALDVSRSMLAEDLRPNRLTRAKLEVHDLIRRLSGDEIGLVLFAGAAFVQFPLTYDYATARTFLDNSNPDMIARQGTVLEEAIDVSMAGLSDDRPSQKVILIISDGENQEGQAVAAAERAAEAGIAVYTIGIGSPEGEPIPVTNVTGMQVGYVYDRQGNLVLSRLNEQVLRDVAEAGGGTFIRAGGRPTAADQIARELDGLQRTTVESQIETTGVERFQLFVGLAIVMLIAGELITNRRRPGEFDGNRRGPA